MTGQHWRIKLPYETPPLSLNRRIHHMKQHRIEQQIMSDVGWLALHAKLPRKELRKVLIQLSWYPGTTRIRDTDNPTPTLKKVIDGLVKYGLVPDDNKDIVESRVFIADGRKGRGEVYVDIYDTHEPDEPGVTGRPWDDPRMSQGEV